MNIFFWLLADICLVILIYQLLIRPIIKGAVYFPTYPGNIGKIIEFADLKNGKMADLGSGDGRVVMAFAEKGIEAHGYEVNPLLVFFSRRLIRKRGLQEKAIIHRKSFWNADLSGFDAVYTYGFPRIMEDLGNKLGVEMRAGTRIISNMYPFPNMEKEKQENGVYLYLK